MIACGKDGGARFVRSLATGAQKLRQLTLGQAAQQRVPAKGDETLRLGVQRVLSLGVRSYSLSPISGSMTDPALKVLLLGGTDSLTRAVAAHLSGSPDVADCRIDDARGGPASGSNTDVVLYLAA